MKGLFETTFATSKGNVHRRYRRCKMPSESGSKDTRAAGVALATSRHVPRACIASRDQGAQFVLISCDDSGHARGRRLSRSDACAHGTSHSLVIIVRIGPFR